MLLVQQVSDRRQSLRVLQRTRTRFPAFELATQPCTNAHPAISAGYFLPGYSLIPAKNAGSFRARQNLLPGQLCRTAGIAGLHKIPINS